jgi:hypothetical protein
VIEPPDVLVLEPQCPEVGPFTLVGALDEWLGRLACPPPQPPGREGLTLEEARSALRCFGARLSDGLLAASGLSPFRRVQRVRGEHAVRPDGTIELEPFGSVWVTGLTVAQAKLAIERHLEPYVFAPEISVEVWTKGRQAYHVIWKGRDNRQWAYCFTLASKETVLDAVARAVQMPSGSLTVYVARPIPRRPVCLQVLWVDWEGMVERGEAATNYPIEPGDCVYALHEPTARKKRAYLEPRGPVGTILLYQIPPSPLEQAWADAQALLEHVCPALRWALQLPGLGDPGSERPPTEL